MFITRTVTEKNRGCNNTIPLSKRQKLRNEACLPEFWNKEVGMLFIFQKPKPVQRNLKKS